MSFESILFMILGVVAYHCYTIIQHNNSIMQEFIRNAAKVVPEPPKVVTKEVFVDAPAPTPAPAPIPKEVVPKATPKEEEEEVSTYRGRGQEDTVRLQRSWRNNLTEYLPGVTNMINYRYHQQPNCIYMKYDGVDMCGNPRYLPIYLYRINR